MSIVVCLFLVVNGILFMQNWQKIRVEGKSFMVVVRDSVISGLELDIAPSFCSNAAPHLSRVKINLVADDDKREVVGVSWTRLYEELVAPAVQRTE